MSISPLYCIQQQLTTNLSWTHSGFCIFPCLEYSQTLCSTTKFTLFCKGSLTTSSWNVWFLSVYVHSFCIYFHLNNDHIVSNQFICILICLISKAYASGKQGQIPLLWINNIALSLLLISCLPKHYMPLDVSDRLQTKCLLYLISVKMH